MTDKRRPSGNIIADEKGVILYKYNLSPRLYGPNWGLSNLCYVDEKFGSVESRYHASKIKFCTWLNGNKLSDIDIVSFEKKILDTVAGFASKSIGTKTQFNKWKISLNVEAFDKVKDSILQNLIAERERIDTWFATQMKLIATNKLILVHPVIRGVSYEAQIDMAIKKISKK
jgi:hypothetical protein